MTTPGIVAPAEITEFWTSAGPSKWFARNEAFDQEIADRFLPTHTAAASGELDGWSETAQGSLALILVLDQFSRNLFRNDPRAFAQDEACIKIAQQAMNRGLDRDLADDLRVFVYMPFMHSEELAHQRTCLEQMQALGRQDNVKYAQIHLDIIEEFGRFPHRNTVLGRQTTAAERKFLDQGGFSG